MRYFTRIKDLDQINSLEGIKLKDGFKFHFSLFFKSKDYGRDYLLEVGNLILFVQDGLIHAGNLDGAKSLKFEEKTYDDFVASFTG